MSQYRMHVLVCGGTGCISSESLSVYDNFVEQIKKAGLENEVKILKTGCFGFCEQGPIIKVYPDNVFYVKVTGDDVAELISEHINGGKVVDRLLYVDPQKGTHHAEYKEIPFYQSQVRIALRNCGVIDPEVIEDYISVRGYEALGEAIYNNTPEGIIDIIKKSELRGRGGAGFPTGLKWDFARKSVSDKKYVMCNADEGDPGAFMDRSLLEGDPHGILEAMAICGYAIGSDEGVIYIRAEYPLAVERLEIAIAQATEMGLLGDNILGSDFSFKISINLGAGAFVCGEESALINSVEGGRGEPRFKPPFPAEKGLWQKPTNINNVETFANICPILLNGADWFTSIGTAKSKGTKVFALAGKINNVGLVEVPMGTTIREVIYEVGGGIPNGKKFKAIQTGGPSGGCIPESYLDLPIDYDSLLNVGSMMGSGGLIVMDEDDCMVNIAKFYLEFTVEESCGKCTPCRIGTTRLLEMLEDVTSGKGTRQTLEDLKELGEIILDTSLCMLGGSAPNPVISTLNFFMDEYLAHVDEKRCPAGKCTDLLQYVVNDKCIGCTVCARNCPVDCISGERKAKHLIDQDKCIKCGVCFTKCKFSAIDKI